MFFTTDESRKSFSLLYDEIQKKMTQCVIIAAVPFCLALVIISMCFMETLRSFFVMRDATSTWEKIKLNYFYSYLC